MNRINTLRIFMIFFLCSAVTGIAFTQADMPGFAIVIHGGAGGMKKENYTPEKEQAYRDALEEAVQIGYKILEEGGSSLDAVEAAINRMEDDSLFNSGRGSVLTNAGTVEMDASIMSGSDHNAGAVAGVKKIKNPVSAARKVMEVSPHVMLSGEGAENFAETNGLPLKEIDYFRTHKRHKSYLKRIEKEKNNGPSDSGNGYFPGDEDNGKYGTVGCVALDREGHIAAGTSTGGMSMKRWGRIGDSPVIGAGTYADDATCGVSCTGHGEYFIREAAAFSVIAMMRWAGLDSRTAADSVIFGILEPIGARGGMIVLDKEGNISTPFNTSGMYRAYMREGENPVVKIFKDH